MRPTSQGPLDLGAMPTASGVRFKVWAPAYRALTVVVEQRGSFDLVKDADGYHCGFVPGLSAGALYGYRLGQGQCLPDPRSRFQPQGPHGPSQVVSPHFRWTDGVWQRRGLSPKGQVYYELHVGTFTPQGTYAGVKSKLSYLKKLGVTAIELMPLAEFPGRFNWGYDGVNLFAPAHTYGTPEDLKDLINTAHGLNIGVLLDVVYNHFGPDGNYLQCYAPYYFTRHYTTDWGMAINFEGKARAEVRKFFLQNALQWVLEYHFDGLRLDATQNIYDQSRTHILAEMASTLRKASPKPVVLIAENEPQDVRLIRKTAQGGFGLDAVWNDDFHHTARVALTGKRMAYYTDYTGTPQEFISLLKYGYSYQGQFYTWQNQVRGTRVDDSIDASQWVIYLQNHDQVSNSLDGRRLSGLSQPDCYRAMTAVLLLAPQTPMLFMGQEFSTGPFMFFADHKQGLSPRVDAGRKQFLQQFVRTAEDRKALRRVPNPADPKTFERSRIQWQQFRRNKGLYFLHQDLIKIRRQDAVFRQQDRRRLDGAVLGPGAFVMRYQGPGTDRLLTVNFADDLLFSPAPEPLLAPLPGTKWRRLWSSSSARYGGKGGRRTGPPQRWFLPGRSAEIYAC